MSSRNSGTPRPVAIAFASKRLTAARHTDQHRAFRCRQAVGTSLGAVRQSPGHEPALDAVQAADRVETARQWVEPLQDAFARDHALLFGSDKRRVDPLELDQRLGVAGRSLFAVQADRRVDRCVTRAVLEFEIVNLDENV